MLRTLLKDARLNPVRNGMRNPSFEDPLGTTQWQGNRVSFGRVSFNPNQGAYSCRVTTLSTGTGDYTFEGNVGWEPTQGGWGGGSLYAGYASGPLYLRPFVRWYSDPVSFGSILIPTNGYVRVELFSEEHPEPTFTSSSAKFGFLMYGNLERTIPPAVGTTVQVDSSIFVFNKDAGIVNRDIKAPYFDATTPNMKADVQAVAIGTSITPVM